MRYPFEFEHAFLRKVDARQNAGRQNAVGNWITMSYDLAGRQLAIFNELGFAASDIDVHMRHGSALDGR